MNTILFDVTRADMTREDKRAVDEQIDVSLWHRLKINTSMMLTDNYRLKICDRFDSHIKSYS